MAGSSPIRSEVDLREYVEAYAAAPAFPHVVLDGFLRDEVAWEAFHAFPRHGDQDWTAYTHFNEKKFGNTTRFRRPFEVSSSTSTRRRSSPNSPR